MDVGKRIAAARNCSGLSQVELAIVLSVTPTYLMGWDTPDKMDSHHSIGNVIYRDYDDN